jgi:hypothetical protein
VAEAQQRKEQQRLRAEQQQAEAKAAAAIATPEDAAVAAVPGADVGEPTRGCRRAADRCRNERRHARRMPPHAGDAAADAG